MILTRTPAKTRQVGLCFDAQRGQALIFTLLFAAVTAIVCLVLYNSGKLANTKTQLQNAADAGAYSGAVLLARDHNFSAYTNRAMVANQVSVAQLVSLKSYIDDAAATHPRMGNGAHTSVTNLVPIIKIPWDIARALPIEAVASAYDVAAPIAVKGLDELIGVMETAQEAHHDATAVNVSLVANQVVQRNDPDASVSLMTFQTAYTAGQIRDWATYTSRQRAPITQLDKERVQGARLASAPRLRITAVEQERRDRDRVSILKQELDDEARKYAAAMQRAKGASAAGDKLSAAEMQRLTEELYGHQKNIQSLNAELRRTRTAQ